MWTLFPTLPFFHKGGVITISFTIEGGNKPLSTYSYKLYSNNYLVESGRIARHRQSAGWRALLRRIVNQSSTHQQVNRQPPIVPKVVP